MELKLSEHIRNTISLLYKQKTGWNSDIWNFFSEKNELFFNFGLFSLKLRFLSPAMFENVIVTSYVDWFSWFWYQWKEETLPYTMVSNNHTLVPSISSSWGGGNHPPPLGKPCYKKRLGRTRVKEFTNLWVCPRTIGRVYSILHEGRLCAESFEITFAVACCWLWGEIEEKK